MMSPDELPSPPTLLGIGDRTASDPRWKLVMTVIAVAAVLALRHPSAAWGALFVALTAAAASEVSWGWLKSRLLFLVPVAALFALPLPFVVSGPGGEWRWGSLVLSLDGLRAATLLVGKLLAVSTVVLVLLATTSVELLLKAAHALRVPGLLIQLGLLTHRYVFVLGDEFARLRMALRVRGFRNRANVHSYRTIGHVAGTLLVRGHERAERVGEAMRCRGFDGQFHTLTHFETRGSDVIRAAAAGLAAAALLAVDRLML